MKIAIVHWQINNIGGILTWYNIVADAYEQLGHEVSRFTVYDWEPRSRKQPNNDYKLGKWRSDGLCIHTEKDLAETMRVLDSHEVVIFGHASPHPTKDQFKRAGEGRQWVKVYERLKTKRMVIFHDNNWEINNAWFADVSEHVHVAVAAQTTFTDCVSRYPNVQREFVYHPLFIPEKVNHDRVRDLGMMATQWVGWKRHKHFLARAEELSNVCRMDLYNVGIQYYYLRKEEWWSQFISDVNKPGDAAKPLCYQGVVQHDVLMAELNMVQFSIDFSKRAYTNYTHFEPLAFGAYSLTHEDTLAFDTCALPTELGMVVPFNDDNYVDVIEDTVNRQEDEDTRDAREATHEWCRQNLDPFRIVNQLLEFVK